MLFVRCRNAQSAVISHFHNFSRVNEIFAKKTLDALRSELKKNPEQVNKVLLVYDLFITLIVSRVSLGTTILNSLQHG